MKHIKFGGIFRSSNLIGTFFVVDFDKLVDDPDFEKNVVAFGAVRGEGILELY